MIILVVIYCFNCSYIFNKFNKELFQSEQETNTNTEQNNYELTNDNIESDESELIPNSLFIILSIIVLCMCCSVMYYFNTNTSVQELIQKKQLMVEQSILSNTSDSSKPYIIIVQPSIVPINQTQPNPYTNSLLTPNSNLLNLSNPSSYNQLNY